MTNKSSSLKKSMFLVAGVVIFKKMLNGISTSKSNLKPRDKAIGTPVSTPLGHVGVVTGGILGRALGEQNDTTIKRDAKQAAPSKGTYDREKLIEFLNGCTLTQLKVISLEIIRVSSMIIKYISSNKGISDSESYTMRYLSNSIIELSNIDHLATSEKQKHSLVNAILAATEFFYGTHFREQDFIAQKVYFTLNAELLIWNKYLQEIGIIPKETQFTKLSPILDFNSADTMEGFLNALSDEQLMTMGLDVIRISTSILTDYSRKTEKLDSSFITKLSDAVNLLPTYIHLVHDGENEQSIYSRDGFVRELVYALDVMKDLYYTEPQFAEHFSLKPFTAGLISFEVLLKPQQKATM